MTTHSLRVSAARWIPAAAGIAAGAYATYAGMAWLRYGHPSSSTAESQDALLDRFMPFYEIVERHHIRISAPAEVAFAAACETDPMESPVVRGIFRAREVILGSEPDSEVRPRGLLELTRSIGWSTLAEVPGREVVMGAVTKPWEANVVFRGLPPEDFAAFDEPDYVKIAWTLRADPVGPSESTFRTETRAVATDAVARAKFRRYWAFLSPGIILIRWMMLAPVKAAAERRVRAAA
jgi:hypothetical protein